MFFLFYSKNSFPLQVMQIQKIDIKQQLLAIAKVEFLANGFENTSIQKIAKKAGLDVSDIYNFFENKDELYVAVLQPLLHCLEKVSYKYRQSPNLSDKIPSLKTFFDKPLQDLIRLIASFKMELYLLLFHSQGSSLESFKENYMDKHAQTSIDFLQKVQQTYPQFNIDSASVFIRILIGWTLTIIGEFVSNNNLSKQEIGQIMKQYSNYIQTGWRKLIAG